MGTFDSFRKAYGALKDSTKVGLAKVNSEFKDLDIAIVKATNHVECPPKERHVRKIFSATSVVVPRADVAYSIHTLFRRLSKTKNWIVAIKTLIVFHRILREGDPSLREELLNYSQRGKVFQISNFKDDSSPLAWDCSAWVRAYGMFLEERLECFRMLGYDIESECLTRRMPGIGKGYSRTRLMSGDGLLEQLPAMQQLLFRLIGCQPEGAAYYNYLVQYALALVLKESFKIYCSINDGIINLVDLFFDMPKHDAIKALNIYKKSGKQAEYLVGLYEYCRNSDLARNFQFPTLRQPPPSFLETMEEYIREAPSIGSVSIRSLEYEAVEDEKIEDSYSQEKNHESLEEKELLLIDPDPKLKSVPKREKEITTFVSSTNYDTDLLGMKQINQKDLELDKNNALALSVVQNGVNPRSASLNWSEVEKKPGWELALVENNIITNYNNTSQANLGGGFDKFLLQSLYEDDATRRQIQLQSSGYNTHYGYDMKYNTFDQPLPSPSNDPFMISSRVAPQMNVQMVMLHQQQMMKNQQQQQQNQNQYSQLYQQNVLVPYNNGHSRKTSNPFGYGYEYPQTSTS